VKTTSAQTSKAGEHITINPFIHLSGPAAPANCRREGG